MMNVNVGSSSNIKPNEIIREDPLPTFKVIKSETI